MTKIENNAWLGWIEYKTMLSKIWNTYKRYGDIVLEKDLEEGDRNVKNLFIQANGNSFSFTKSIRKYWEDNYHFVADNYAELVDIFLNSQQVKQKNIYSLELLPETGGYREKEIKGYDQTYSVTLDFYLKLKEDISKKSGRKEILLIKRDDKRVFQVKFTDEYNTNIYNKIVITEKTNEFELIMI